MIDGGHVAYLGIGSNLGDKMAQVAEAIDKIEKLIGRVERQSAFYFSEPWGFESKNSFVNVVVACRTALTPRHLLHATQAIEQSMGRKEKTRERVYHDRPIDIDILLYDDLHVDYPDLKIPHPLMWERDFVMVPLREIWEK